MGQAEIVGRSSPRVVRCLMFCGGLYFELAGKLIMSNDATNFAGNIPEHYDRGLGPVIFAGYAADLARRPPPPFLCRMESLMLSCASSV